MPGAGTGTDGAAVAGNGTGWKGDGVWLQGGEDQAGGPGCSAPALLHGSFPLHRSHGLGDAAPCCGRAWGLQTAVSGFEGWELCGLRGGPAPLGEWLGGAAVRDCRHCCCPFSAFVSPSGLHSGSPEPLPAWCCRHSLLSQLALHTRSPCSGTAAHCAFLTGTATPIPPLLSGTALCTPAWLHRAPCPVPHSHCPTSPAPYSPVPAGLHPQQRAALAPPTAMQPHPAPCTAAVQPRPTPRLLTRRPSGCACPRAPQKLLPGEAGPRRAWSGLRRGFAWA